MRQFETPGVAVVRAPERPAPRPRLTSVTGLVGLAERGPINSPQRLEGWGHYEAIFGAADGSADLPLAVFGFFANGGRVCYAVRTADTRSETLRPAASRFRFFNSAGNVVMAIEAANEGAWGDALEIRFAPGRERIELTRLARPAAAGASVLELASTLDLYAGAAVTLVDAGGSRLRVTAEVDAVLSARRARLTAPLAAPLAPGSPVLGRGLDLAVTLGERREEFVNLSLEPRHPRYLVDVVNGEAGESSYLAKLAAGASILVRVDPASLVRPEPPPLARWVRPLRGVDLTTQAPLAALPPGLEPRDLGSDLVFDAGAGRLVLTGMMSAAERDRLLALASEPSYQAAVGALFAASQTYGLARAGRDPGGPLEVGHYTGYRNGAYFPGADPSVDGYQGLASLETVEEVSLVAIPDLHRAAPAQEGPGAGFLEGQRAILAHCDRMGDRFAILDAPPLAAGTADPPAALVPDHVDALALSPGSRDGGIYYPWVRAVGPDGSEVARPLPPCGFVAGVYGRTDTLEGVHRAPANEELEEVFELQFPVDDADQEELNRAGVNCLRALPGRGIRVWGARTLSAEAAWRHVPVRRLLLAMRKEIRHSLAWTVFEPNDLRLQRGVAASLRSYLASLHRADVLVGVSPEESFFVKCDAETNPPDLLERGELVAEIGFAPLHPAEFIIATIRRSAEAIDVTIPG